jgi:peptide-methionine (S)-S-oxide reductase
MIETATFGGGCFWCLEAVFERLQGVERVVSGYAGGPRANPSYEQVCTGATGHAEVIQVSFDPGQISYRELIELFFAFHDPTTLNAQGPDTGTQYRSIILTASSEQERIAQAVIAELSHEDAFGAPMVTHVTPLDAFWPAEAYHQQYFQRNPARAYCAAMIAPKLAKLRRTYAARLKPEQPQGRRG